jgi:hypothetical protein
VIGWIHLHYRMPFVEHWPPQILGVLDWTSPLE